MTGRDLTIAIAAAAIVGGAAGALASLATAPKTETTPAEPPAEFAARLKSAEDALARTQAALENSRKTVNELSERVTAAEIKSAREAAAGAAAPNNAGPVRVGRHRAADAAAAPGAEQAMPVFDAADLGDGLAVELGKVLAANGEEMGGMASELKSLQAGLALRKLPEADRWEKAKDDLGLTWNQVEDLKKAVAARDEAMKNAMTTENKTNANGGAVTIKRPDAGKAAHATADYHDRVNATLNEDQRKSWNSKGYDHAFGSGPVGGAGGATMVMSIDMASDKKDAPK
jgi:hypothetical protein